MPVAATMHHLRSWRERQQARQNHERVGTEEEEEAVVAAAEGGGGGVIAHPLEETASAPPTPDTETALVDAASEEEEDDDDIENQRRPSSETTTGGVAVPIGSGSEASAAAAAAARRGGRRSGGINHRFSLEDLEEERELARRRTSGCVLIAAFVLFRLWIQAVSTSDFGLLFLCLLGTSWTARFIRHNRHREEHLDRLIVEYNESGGGGRDGGDGGVGGARMLSFQAQLALAIIESQRQMMEGGYGHPDGPQNSPGVSDGAKERWENFRYKSSEGLPGSSAAKGNGEDEPHCSICLCEYEEKDHLVLLPCGHVYHKDCIDSWCSNHQRCPLCNVDLEAFAQTDDETGATSSSS